MEKYKVTDKFERYGTHYYYFSISKHEILVRITRYQGITDRNYYSIGFGVVEQISTCYDTSIIVNENPYKIMRTVFSIAKSFMRKNIVHGFIFSFMGDLEKNNKRLLLYQRFIKSQFPNSTIELIDNIYRIHLN